MHPTSPNTAWWPAKSLLWTRQRRRSDAPGGASQLGPDFLKGINTGTRPGATGNPADAASEQVKAAIRVTINRKVLPPWNSCPVNGVEIEKLRASVPKLGLDAPLPGGGTLRDIAAEVLAISRNGLAARARLNDAGDNETGYLQPLDEIVSTGKVPAERLLDLYHGAWGGKVDPIYEAKSF